MAIENHEERLAYLAFNMLFPDQFSGVPEKDEQHELYQRILDHVAAVWDGLPDSTRKSLDGVYKKIDDPLSNRAYVKNGILSILADSYLHDRAAAAGIEDEPPITDKMRPIREAGARLMLGHSTDADKRLIDRWIEIHGGNVGMPPPGGDGDSGAGGHLYDGGFEVDRRNLPDSFDHAAQADLVDHVTVLAAERDLDDGDPADAAQIAYILGSLIRGSYYSANSPGFASTFSDEYNKGFVKVESLDGDRIIARQVYVRVAGEIADIKGSEPSVQEVAAVSDDVIDLGPVDDHNFRAKVRASHTDFVARQPSYDSLDLPDIVTDDTAQAEVEPTNVRAVSMIYAASHLESMIQACDQIAQDWTDGYIPVGESASRDLDAYVWNARDRLDATAREIQTDKIKDLESHLLRFCSATSERDRSRYLSEYLVGDNRRTSAQPRDAAVRKAARDMLAFASLHGWAYAQSASKRLGNQIRECTSIVSNPEVQKAYGVQGPWQLIERSHQMNTGFIPPVAKERTLASTGKEILDLLATKSKDIAASLAKDPLFPTDDVRGGRSIFTYDEYEQLLGHVENWLAANGINDNERVAASRINDKSSAPSLPSFGGGGGFGGSGFDVNTARDQLMQMAATGQVIDPGQINQLFNIGAN